MKNHIKNITIFSIHIFCIFALVELVVNFFAPHYLFPIKNASSYGYVTKKGAKTIISLNKYSTRQKAQLALPYELLKSTFQNNKELNKSFDKLTQKYGYTDNKNKVVIDYKFDKVEDFNKDYAIVAVNIENKLKYGTIDKQGNWIIEPKYEHLCPFLKYYTKACLDKDHCGVIDRYGNEITLMSYRTNKIADKNSNYGKKLCTIGEKNQINCNYFL